MALRFADNSGNNVNHGSGASLDFPTSGTLLFWYLPDDILAAFRQIAAKDGNTGTGWLIFKEGSQLKFTWGGTTAQDIISASGTIVADVWTYAAIVFDRAAGAATDLHMYIGSLTTLAAEVSYASRVVGTGHSDDSANVFNIGGQGGAEAHDMDLAWCAFYPGVKLTLGEIRAQQFFVRAPLFAGCKLFCHYGFNGTGTQPDHSGSFNSGTVTGATVAPHVPLALASPHIYSPYVIAAAPGGGKPWLHYARQRA